MGYAKYQIFPQDCTGQVESNKDEDHFYLNFKKRLIQLIIAMTQTEASCKHKLPHKERCLTLLLFVKFAETLLPK